MKFGFCTDTQFMNELNNEQKEKSRKIFNAIAEAGFDYLETQLSDIVDMDKEKYLRLKKELEANNLTVKGGLLLLPRNMPLLTEDMNITQIVSRTEQTLNIAADLGTETVVFAPRRINDNDDLGKALDRMKLILSSIDPIAGKHGIQVVVEPLCQRETNTLNTIQQAADLLSCIEAPNTGILCDLYHVRADGLTLDAVIANSAMINHLHIAYPIGRTLPSQSDDMAEYEEFSNAVKQIGYKGKLSIECILSEISVEKFKEALEIIQKLF